MVKYVYVVSVVNKSMDVPFINYVIKRLDSLDKVIDAIKKQYNIEFKQLTTCFHNGCWQFDTVYENMEITMVVERVESID